MVSFSNGVRGKISKPVPEDTTFGVFCFMEEIIKIQTSQNGSKLVSARNLYEFLEIKERFGRWFDRQLQFGFVENQDYTPYQMVHASNNQETIDYALSLDMAKEVSMVQRSDKGKEARLYFIECEKQLNIQKQIPQTYKEALLALVAAEEEKEQLLLEKENLSTALDSLVEWVSIIKVAQFNKVSEKVFNWRNLKAKSLSLGYLIKKAESARYDYQNLYHVNVFRACYPNFNYNFLN